MVTRECQICGVEFKTYNAWIKKGGGKFCSKRCGTASTRVILANRVRDSRPTIGEQPAEYRIIPLNRGKTALVSIEDYQYLSQFNWTVVGKGYARRQWRDMGYTYVEYMHHAVYYRATGVTLPQGFDVDHENRTPGDNRRSNLRKATKSQNAANSVRKEKAFRRGVFKAGPHSFVAQIKSQNVSITIGTFECYDIAGWMYDQWALALHEEFAVLNFDYQ